METTEDDEYLDDGDYLQDEDGLDDEGVVWRGRVHQLLCSVI